MVATERHKSLQQVPNISFELPQFSFFKWTCEKADIDTLRNLVEIMRESNGDTKKPCAWKEDAEDHLNLWFVDEEGASSISLSRNPYWRKLTIN